MGKVMCKLSGGKINPLIGSAGVSAVPMAARVSQVVGQQENPGNFLLYARYGPQCRWGNWIRYRSRGFLKLIRLIIFKGGYGRAKVKITDTILRDAHQSFRLQLECDWKRCSLLQIN